MVCLVLATVALFAIFALHTFLHCIALQYPAAASTPNQKGKIPLHYAAREGRSLAMVQYFLRAAPETVRIATTKGKLAVHFAAGDGHAAIASELLRYYPESAVVATSSKGKLPLHFCARWGYLDIAYELLHVHPEAVRAMDWEGSLPLHDAAREGQYQMSRYLIERFPQALQTANLRGEIPLFSAVRSANIKLALLMIQAWPLGGRHILRHNASVFDDHVSGWNADILELLLRGAVDNLRDETECPLLRGHEPPTVRLMNPTTATSVAIGNTWVNGDFAPHKPTDTMKRFKKACGLNSAAALKLVGQCSASAVSTKYPPYHHEQQQQQKERNDDKDEPQQNAAFFLGQCDSVSSPKATNAATMALMRSKSPILSMEHEVHETAIDSKAPDMKREARKRSRRNQRHSLDEEGLLVERKFIHLHAAFESKVSSHVIQHILQAHAEDRTKVDERGRLALHWAVTHCQEDHDDIVNLIITSNLITQSAASTPDSSGKYPLHLAIESRADVRIISALLLAYPVVGVDPCRTTDSLFSDATPVQMATHCGCDLSTVFLLLRVDPSFVTRMVHDFR